MARRFDSFVILADMRTGSNALEEKLNDFEGLFSHGEVFNPHFVGHAGAQNLFGVTRAGRDADPAAMLKTLADKTDGIPGFRLFSGHDRRVLDLCLADPRRAKIVLTRAPLESYVSLKIARKTGQWWLGDLTGAQPGKARFDPAEFERFLAARSEWLGTIRRGLQTSGQAAFEIGYAGLGDDQVIAGLARFLGGGAKKSRGGTRKGRIQNPVPMEDKVENYAAMRTALAKRDAFDLDALPDHEPSRGPNIPSYLATRSASLLYMPVKCADDRRVRAWMEAIDAGETDPLESGFTNRSLRQWKRKRGAHVSFTVVTHPVERAHEAFCRDVLPTGKERFASIRDTLVTSYKLPLPEDPEAPAYDLAAHREAFLAFLAFLKGNLGGQTAVRVDAAWASQEHVLRGLAEFGMPDAVLRGAMLDRDLAMLAERAGIAAPDVPAPVPSGRFALGEVYDAGIEEAARAAYQRDYMMFGFSAWR